MASLLRKLQYWIHLGDESAGGKVCGGPRHCSICLRYSGPYIPNPHNYLYEQALRELEREIPLT